jgi:hypothetical protein
MAKLSPFQMTQAKSHAGLTTKNHLGAMYAQKPQMLTNVVNKMLSASGVANIDTFLNSLPVKYVDSDDDFTWKLVGSSERNIPLVEARVNGTPVGTSGNVGQSGGEIELVFGERYFSDVNVLVGEKNEIYQFRVMDEPDAEGTNYVYRVTLMGPAVNGVPAEELQSGKRFSKDFSPVEDTMSIKGGDIVFASPIEMRNEFTTIRMEHKVPGNMLGRRTSTTIAGLDANGNVKETTVWMQEVEWRFEQAFSREKARALMFSRSNRDENGSYHDVGKSGFVIKQGAGIREQMEVSNTTYYNKFSLDALVSQLQDLSEGKLDFGNRTFIVRTGERGAIQFHKQVNLDISGWTSLSQNNPGVYQSTSSPLHSNAFKAGFQFTEWLAPNGIKVLLEIDPMYDDKVRNKILHPDGGVAESYRYAILYVGTSEEPNIQKVLIKGQEEFRGYSSGFRNPFTGQINNQFMGTMEDSATYTRYATFGVAVIDPSRTISMIPDILA